MGKVVVIGSINTDFIVHVNELPSPGQTRMGEDLVVLPGGKGGNQALAAARAGASVVFIAAVGDDDRGAEAIARCKRDGIDASRITIKQGCATGAALIMTDDASRNLIAVAPGANAQLAPRDIDAAPDDVFADAVVLAVLESPPAAVERALMRARSAGAKTILNPAPPRPEMGLDLLRLVDVLIPNQDEAEQLVGAAIADVRGAGEVAAAIVALGPGCVVLTLGAEGCVVAVRNAPTVHMPALRIDVKDTVGAGDVFCGAFAAASSRGAEVAAAARFALAASALKIQSSGAQVGVPSRSDIEKLIADKPQECTQTII